MTPSRAASTCFTSYCFMHYSRSRGERGSRPLFRGGSDTSTLTGSLGEVRSVHRTW